MNTSASVAVLQVGQRKGRVYRQQGSVHSSQSKCRRSCAALQPCLEPVISGCHGWKPERSTDWASHLMLRLSLFHDGPSEAQLHTAPFQVRCTDRPGFLEIVASPGISGCCCEETAFGDKSDLVRNHKNKERMFQECKGHVITTLTSQSSHLTFRRGRAEQRLSSSQSIGSRFLIISHTPVDL